MKLTKPLAVICCAVLCCSAFAADKKQSKSKSSSSKKSSSKKETTVEDEYLSSVEDVIIGELAASDDHDNKLIALSYIEDAVSGGRTSPELMASLTRLAGEGVRNQSRTKGRLTNNYPDIRSRACVLLGTIKTEESKTVLLQVANDEKEPAVVSAAIKALGEVGINENDEVITTIEFIHRKHMALNPNSPLALEVLNAYEKLEPTVQDKASLIQSVTEIASNYQYLSPVRQKASDFLKKLQEESAEDSSNKSSDKKDDSTAAQESTEGEAAQ